MVELVVKKVKRQLAASLLPRNFKRVLLDFFFLGLPLVVNERGSDRFEKLQDV